MELWNPKTTPFKWDLITRTPEQGNTPIFFETPDWNFSPPRYPGILNPKLKKPSEVLPEERVLGILQGELHTRPPKQT